MAAKAPSPHNAGLVRRPTPIAHDYAPTDPEGACMTNLAARLYVTKTAGTDWKLWAKTTGDKDIIDAVNDALKAVDAAHKKVTTKLRQKLPKED